MIPDVMLTPRYTLAEAAKIIGIPTGTIRSWARGRDFPTKAGTLGHSPALVTDTGVAQPGHATLPFMGLAEAAFLAAVRSTGVPMQRIRPALERLRDELGLEHALASKELFSDGAELLYRVGVESGATDRDIEYVVVRNNQGVFAPVVHDYLRHVRFGPSGYVEAIRLPKYGEADVIVDPRFGFGRPVLESNGVRVATILDRFDAGESVPDLATDFGVTPAVVEQLLRANLHLAA
ncbi:MAG: DUF433 domain-containing protein [Demequina sp.]|jgi:uncharacterized protein (DUF433 family)|nr:DUF433 domain-containing protein [Demequina sp.]